MNKIIEFLRGKRTHSLIAVLSMLAAGAGVDLDPQAAIESLDSLASEIEKLGSSWVVLVGLVQGWAHYFRRISGKGGDK